MPDAATLQRRRAASAQCRFLDLVELSQALAEARMALLDLHATIRDAGVSHLHETIAAVSAVDADGDAAPST